MRAAKTGQHWSWPMQDGQLSGKAIIQRALNGRGEHPSSDHLQGRIAHLRSREAVSCRVGGWAPAVSRIGRGRDGTREKISIQGSNTQPVLSQPVLTLERRSSSQVTNRPIDHPTAVPSILDNISIPARPRSWAEPARGISKTPPNNNH